MTRMQRVFADLSYGTFFHTEPDYMYHPCSSLLIFLLPIEVSRQFACLRQQARAAGGSCQLTKMKHATH